MAVAQCLSLAIFSFRCKAQADNSYENIALNLESETECTN